MARKILKWLGIVLGAIVMILVVFVGWVYWSSAKVINKTYELKGTNLYAKGDSAAIAWGRHLGTALTMCVECHGEDMGGKLVADAGPVGKLEAPNVTRGKGSVLPEDYSIADFELLMRHGVMHDGRGVYLMPSYHYCYLSDDDVSALWSWMQSLPPVNRTHGGIQLGPLGRFLVAQDIFPLPAPEMINHTANRPPKPPAEVSAEYGKYLARISCVGCHGLDLSGGPIEGAPPDWPPGTNLTDAVAKGKYSEKDFFNALVEGVRPGGNPLSEIMPFKLTSEFTDDEIRALYMYLQTLEPKPFATFAWHGPNKAP